MKKISVYIDDGRVFEYEVETAEKVREHAAAIARAGYSHNDGKIYEYYPPHRILKIKSEGIDTMFPDTVRNT